MTALLLALALAGQIDLPRGAEWPPQPRLRVRPAAPSTGLDPFRLPFGDTSGFYDRPLRPWQPIRHLPGQRPLYNQPFYPNPAAAFFLRQR